MNLCHVLFHYGIAEVTFGEGAEHCFLEVGWFENSAIFSAKVYRETKSFLARLLRDSLQHARSYYIFQ